MLTSTVSLQAVLRLLRETPVQVLGAIATALIVGAVIAIYLVLYLFAPVPRSPLPTEKTYTYITSEGATRKHQPLPCWYDTYVAEKEALLAAGKAADDVQVEPATIYVSLVVPAFNEEERLGIMLTEAVAYLEKHYGSTDNIRVGGSTGESGTPSQKSSKNAKAKKSGGVSASTDGSSSPSDIGGSRSYTQPTGYEIILVSDGSTDRTVETALAFARQQLPPASRPNLRVVQLERNRGKGGAVTHGLRHVRGAYALFADADGATRFSDLGAVLEAARVIEMETAGESREEAAKVGSRSQKAATESETTLSPLPAGAFPAVSVGSRAHMVNTPAVVKRSALRNLLMRGFHLFLRLMTPPRTARIGDTQCGFKLFSRAALPAIVPWMHMEGWIFDVEMLMLAESAGIDVAECPVGWKEIGGSKLNVVWDSLGMAWGLALLRGAWMLGIYRRKW